MLAKMQAKLPLKETFLLDLHRRLYSHCALYVLLGAMPELAWLPPMLLLSEPAMFQLELPSLQ